jgi:hypothetical protein
MDRKTERRKIERRVRRELMKMAESFFVGMAHDSLVAVNDENVIDGVEYRYGTGLFDTIKGQRYAVCEQTEKFVRQRKKIVKHKNDKRHNVAVIDKMIISVGEPGSPERKQALAEQYQAIEASGKELSVFADD